MYNLSYFRFKKVHSQKLGLKPKINNFAYKNSNIIIKEII